MPGFEVMSVQKTILYFDLMSVQKEMPGLEVPLRF